MQDLGNEVLPTPRLLEEGIEYLEENLKEVAGDSGFIGAVLLRLKPVVVQAYLRAIGLGGIEQLRVAGADEWEQGVQPRHQPSLPEKLCGICW